MTRFLASTALAVIVTTAAQAQTAASPAASSDDAATATPDSLTVIGLRPTDVSDVTAAVSVLDRASLEVRGAPYLVDQLRAAPGVAVSRNGALGGLTQVRIRGAEANHTLVLIDGIEVSDPVTGETDFGVLAGLDPQRIEIARGEQSVFHGSDAIGGVIAVTTFGGAGLRAALEAGTRGTVNGHAAFDTALGDGVSFGASLAGFTTDGVDTSGSDGEKDGSQSLSGAVRGAVALGDGWRLSGLARMAHTEADFDSDTDFDGRLNDVDRHDESLNWNAGASLEGAAFGLDHQARIGFTDVTREAFADGEADGETSGQRLKLSYSPAWERDTGAARWRVAGLVDAEFEDYERRAEASFFGDPNQARSFDTLGVAGEARLSQGAFTANASVRQDFNDEQFDDATTWRLGGAYAFDFGGRARASLGRGVKNPTFIELFGFFPGSFLGDPDLKAETSLGWELGWDQRVGPVEASLTYFEASLEDEIVTVFNPDFTSSPANLDGESQRSGVEAALAWRVSDTLQLRAAASRIDSQDDDGADEIRVPDWTGSLSVDWRSARREGLRVGVTLDYVGEQDDLNFGSFPAQTVTLDSYLLASASAAIPVSERIALTARGENLFDADVVDVFGYTNPGVTVLVGFAVR